MSLNILLSLVQVSFEQFHSFISGLRVLENDKVDLFRNFLDFIDADQSLSSSEKDRRVVDLFVQLKLPGEGLRKITEHMRTIKSPIIRNTVAGLLPPELRSSILRKEPVPSPKVTVIKENLMQESGQSLAKDESPNPGSGASLDTTNEAGDVLLLSMDEDQATRTLLKSAGFTALRYSSTQEVQSALTHNQEICAIVIEASFLVPLDAEEQKKLILGVGSYSTFTWIKIAESPLLMDREEVSSLIAQSRCSPTLPAVNQLLLTDRGGIQERDIQSIRISRNRLSAESARSLFVPGELDDAELRLLVAALTDFVHRKHFRLKASVSLIKTKFVQTGRPEDAKVAIIRVNELRIPIIVKVASGSAREIIVEEAKRFYTFIQAGDKDLNPEIHMHGNCALLIFGLIQSSDDDQEPAPTLDEVMKSFWFAEMFGEDLTSKHAVILKGVGRAIRKTAGLNKVLCTKNNFASKANPYLQDLKKMETRGFNWGFGSDALKKRDAAELLIQSAAVNAIAQGDLHTRNVLLRGEDGFVIDYAYSGPGHPCTDLVRLELSLFFNYFTPFVPDSILVEIQRDFTFAKSSAQQVFAKFPEAFPSNTNRLCIEMCAQARDSAAEVISAHHLCVEHYFAVKLLAAWQGLQVPNLQRSLVRVVIEALSL